jgi:MFS family permease
MRSRERVLTPRFVLVVTSGLAYFIALGAVLPVVPQYVKHELGGDDLSVGIAVGALFVGAVALRPYAGRLGDRFGRRVLIVSGAAIVAGSILIYGMVDSLAFLIGARVLTGLGEAAFFVGAATMVADLAPVDRRGEAFSYWSVAVYGGMAFGPVIGESVLDGSGADTVWLVAGGLGAVAAILGVFTREVPRPEGAPVDERIINRAAVGPGTVLFSGLIALAAFVSFVPLYVDDVGLGSADSVFLLYGGLVLAVRVVGARLPDWLGARRAGVIALAFTALGMTVMAAWSSTAGLLVGTASFGVGMSLLYPALLVLALSNAPETERASVVGTFSSFFDMSQGLGALTAGGVAEAVGYRGAFGAGAVSAVLGVTLLRTRTVRQPSQADIEEAGAMAAEHSAT